MKAYGVIVLAIMMSFTEICLADNAFPIGYWQLADQDRYLYRFDLERFDWRKIREIRKQNTTAGRETKVLTLNALSPLGDMVDTLQLERRYLAHAEIVVRDPNGVISRLPTLPTEEKTVSLPEDNNLRGRYLLGARIPVGEYDVDADGIEESVILCAKYLVVHGHHGGGSGRMGRASVVFFDDGKKMPLEIGPAIDTAKSRFGGGMQMPHAPYEMMVKYQGRPLPGATVTVTTEGSQWKKTVVTDKTGKFEIMPTDDRFFPREWQNYLYTATHHDQRTNIYYVATLPTVVYKNRPEWRSKAMGFAFWSIVGTGIGLIMVAGLSRRRIHRDRQALVIFENHKIKENHP